MTRTIIIALLMCGAGSGCRKCEDCYLVRTTASETIETPVGEYCGNARKQLEDDHLVCLNGTCTYTCR